MHRISFLTIVFLVLLRLAIGWHSLFEGVAKYQSASWSSEPYLRESVGPLAPRFRNLAGDPLAERLTPKPAPGGDAEIKKTLSDRMPPALAKEWNAWFKAYLKTYGLPTDSKEKVEDKLQGEAKALFADARKIDDELDATRKTLAEVNAAIEKLKLETAANKAEGEKLAEERAATVGGLKGSDLKVKEEYFDARKAGVSAKKSELEGKLKEQDKKKKALEEKQEQLREQLRNRYKDTAEAERRVAQRLLAEVRLEREEDQAVRWMLTGKDEVSHASPYGPPSVRVMTVPERIAAYDAKFDQAHTLEDRDLRAASDSIARDEIRKKIKELKEDANRMRAGLKGELDARTKGMEASVLAVLDPEQYFSKPMPARVPVPLLERNLLGWVDFLVPLALVVLGGCLLLGFFTRTACVLGALLLLSFYVAMPPLPWVEILRSEGHYLIINKNVVEILALLTLATTASGRWVGIDGMLRFLWGRKKAPKPAPAPAK
jgi:uncharacterized membrane protein YphA (DoxX/SURF4 family)